GALGNMMGYVAERASFGVKLVSLFPRNAGTGLSSHLGVVVLFEAEHGQPVALLDAGAITAIRTAAASGLATRLLARADADDLALIGAGEQAVSHLEAMLAVRPIRRVRVWSRHPERARAFAERAAHHGVPVVPVPHVREAVDGANIICTLTKASEPILLDDWVTPGAHLNVVGSSVATAAEIDTSLVRRSRFFVDYRISTEAEAGEYLRARAEGATGADHLRGESGEVVDGLVPGRERDDDVTIYKSLGIAPQDVASAHHILLEAQRRGSGEVVAF